MQLSIKEVAVDQFIEKTDPERKDMQGLIARGYNSLNAACYILLKITNHQLAKAYLNDLCKNYITTADTKKRNDLTENGDPEYAVQIAFTSSGLKELQLPDKVLETFSREFLEGMTQYTTQNSPNQDDQTGTDRSLLLGDTRKNHPMYWNWGSNKKNEVDCMLMLYAKDNNDLAILKGTVFTNLKQGVNEINILDTFEYAGIDKEHFGFEDGISQPIIKGFSKTKQMESEKLFNKGEFILGYLNDYNSYSPSPYIPPALKKIAPNNLPCFANKKDLGKNGTYLVFRQLEQHVEKFWKYLYNNSKETAVTRTEKAIKFGAKMVGRWPEGQPLVTCPAGNCPTDKDSLNKFKYAELDKDGVHCPFGAHIRRTNPRDQVHTGRGPKDSLEMSNRHRMLRRGRIYGRPLNKSFNIEEIIKSLQSEDLEEGVGDIQLETKRGLHFICLVSDISRQFEFVQSVWANTSTFGDLCNEVDPLISPRPTKLQPDCHEFTTPQELVRNRYTSVPEFTTVVGGAYFFMPGMNALKYIIADHS